MNNNTYNTNSLSRRIVPFTRLKIRYLHFVFWLLLLLTSCNKADNFYQELYDKPEIMELGYKTTYEVGDTFALYGRLHIDKGVTLHIGDVDAKLVYQGYDEIHKTELIKTLITASMGAGNNRPVKITAGNAMLDAPSINIYSSAGAGYLQDTLALENYLKLPTNVIFLNCLSGNGNVYYWVTTEKKMYVAQSDGSTKMLLLASGLTDESGVYTVSTFYSGAVDPGEQQLYFSALTTDNSADNTRNFIYRLCRIDLQTGKLTTLNRTLVRKGTVQAIPADLPLEGAIGTVKLSGVGQMYPDKEGNIYLQPRIMSDDNTANLRFATALLHQSGELEYLLKSNISGQTARIALLPGTAVDQNQGIIAPDDKLMFTNPLNKINTIIGYNLSLKVQLYTLATQKPSDSAAPVLYGDFSGLSGDTEQFYRSQPARFGFMPLHNGRLLLFYYLGMTGVDHYEKFPAVGVLDFPNSKGDKYSSGRLETGSFEMRGAGSDAPAFLYNDMPISDKMLNYDDRGMIYMSADNRSFLVKTRIK